MTPDLRIPDGRYARRMVGSAVSHWRDRRAAGSLRRAAVRDVSPPPAEAFAHFGRRSVVVPPARIPNPRYISIGDDVEILELAFLVVVGAFPGVTPRLVLGNGVSIGRGATFGVISEVEIGPGARIGDFSLVVDTIHPGESDDRLVDVVPGAPVRIGRGAVVGCQVTVLPGVTIGDGAVVEHRAVVGRDVEPGEVFAGHPAWRRRVRGSEP